MSIIEKILELMLEKKISATKLQNDLGLNANAVLFWKNGRQKPSIDALMKLADYFNVSLDELTGRNSNTAQNIGNGILIQGDNNNANNGATGLAQELLSILDKLPNSKKALLLAKAYELLENN